MDTKQLIELLKQQGEMLVALERKRADGTVVATIEKYPPVKAPEPAVELVAEEKPVRLADPVEASGGSKAQWPSGEAPIDGFRIVGWLWKALAKLVGKVVGRSNEAVLSNVRFTVRPDRLDDVVEVTATNNSTALVCRLPAATRRGGKAQSFLVPWDQLKAHVKPGEELVVQSLEKDANNGPRAKLYSEYNGEVVAACAEEQSFPLVPKPDGQDRCFCLPADWARVHLPNIGVACGDTQSVQGYNKVAFDRDEKGRVIVVATDTVRLYFSQPQDDIRNWPTWDAKFAKDLVLGAAFVDLVSDSLADSTGQAMVYANDEEAHAIVGLPGADDIVVRLHGRVPDREFPNWKKITAMSPDGKVAALRFQRNQFMARTKALYNEARKKNKGKVQFSYDSARKALDLAGLTFDSQLKQSIELERDSVGGSDITLAFNLGFIREQLDLMGELVEFQWVSKIHPAFLVDDANHDLGRRWLVMPINV